MNPGFEPESVRKQSPSLEPLMTSQPPYFRLIFFFFFAFYKWVKLSILEHNQIPGKIPLEFMRLSELAGVSLLIGKQSFPFF